MIEIKKWEAYSIDEQKTIIDFWFQHYTDITITLEEWNTYLHYLDNETDKLYYISLIAHKNNLGPTFLILLMRCNKLQPLFYLDTDTLKGQDYDKISNNFINMVVDTYNHINNKSKVKNKV